MRLLVWAFRALLFFTLFAFALNNEQSSVVNGFFGTQWRAPMVIIVLAAFGLGAAMGVLAMVPDWWRHRRLGRLQTPVAKPEARPSASAATAAAAAPPDLTAGYIGDAPPREGL